MAIAMKCPSCRTAFDFPDELSGKRIKCKSCGEIFKIDVSAPKPSPRPAPASKTAPAVKPAPSKAPPPPPKPKASAAFEDEDDDRPRSRRKAEDDDNQPRSKRRVSDDDEDDDKPSRRAKWDDDDDDDAPRPVKKKKIHPLLIIGPVLGVVAVSIIVVALVFFRGGKGKDLAEERTKGVGTVVTIEHPEKDVSQIVAVDAGNQFGVFRKPESHGRTYEIEPVDVTTGKSAGKHRIPELEAPKYVAMSADGKHVIVEQESGHDRALSIYSTEKKAVVVPKWVPYARKNIFNDATLYKAEFIGNDKLMTISTKRAVNVWQLPDFSQAFEPKTIKSVGDPLTGWMDHGDEIKHERLVAFSADRSQVAVWTGDGYMVVNTADGEELVKLSTNSLRLSKAKAGPVAWRPDGKVLAMVFEHGDFGSASTVLVLWNPTAETPPVVHPLYATQFNQAKGINWWGNRYIATTGSSIEGILIDSQTGKAVRQLMAPPKKVVSFSRNGRLWYVATPERKDRPNVNDPANVVMVDSPDELIEKDPNPEPYEVVKDASKGLYLRRLWMEPDGVTRLPVRYDPPLKQRLIGQP